MWCYLIFKILRNEIWDFCRICLWSHLAVKRLKGATEGDTAVLRQSCAKVTN